MLLEWLLKQIHVISNQQFLIICFILIICFNNGSNLNRTATCYRNPLQQLGRMDQRKRPMRSCSSWCNCNSKRPAVFFGTSGEKPDDKLDVWICLITEHIELERIGGYFRFWGCHIQHWPGAASLTALCRFWTGGCFLILSLLHMIHMYTYVYGTVYVYLHSYGYG